MKRKKLARPQRAKRVILESIFLRHNHRSHPIKRETFMLIVTLAFRVIEDIWLSVDAEEAFKTICSNPNISFPPDKGFARNKHKRTSRSRLQ